MTAEQAGEITDNRFRRGRFTTVVELVEARKHWAEHWTHDPKPFV